MAEQKDSPLLIETLVGDVKEINRILDGRWRYFAAIVVSYILITVGGTLIGLQVKSNTDSTIANAASINALKQQNAQLVATVNALRQQNDSIRAQQQQQGQAFSVFLGEFVNEQNYICQITILRAQESNLPQPPSTNVCNVSLTP